MPNHTSIFKTISCAIFFLMTSMLSAQHTTSIQSIQLGTFSDYQADNFKSIQDLGHIHTQALPDGRVRVLLGRYTQASEAESALASAKNRGFKDAFLNTQNVSGTEVSVIQLATFQYDVKIPWARFLNVGNIYKMLDGAKIKIVSGNYTDEEEARKQLLRAKEMGFSEAFIKKINNQLLQWVTVTDTGGLEQQAVTVIKMVPSEYAMASGYVPATPHATPSEYMAGRNIKTARPATLRDIPQAGNQPKLVAIKTFRQPRNYEKSNTTIIESPTLIERPIVDYNTNFVKRSPAPKIYIKSKRTSVQRLQEILQKEELYTGGIDGQYGPKTYAAYQQMLEEKPQLRKYIAMVQFSEASPQGDCRDLEVVQLLMRIAQDIDFSSFSAENERYLKTLYHHPLALDENQLQLIISWDYRFRRGLKNWAATDPLRAEVAGALQVAYLQSQIQLEDYFASKKFSKKQAQGLALTALKYLVGSNLERFQTM